MDSRLVGYGMVPLLGLVAVLQTTVGPYLAIARVQPDLVLLVILVWTLVFGSREGIIWAFVGGVWMDVFGSGPIGTSSLALMAASILVSFGHNRLYRSHLFVPLAVSLIGTAGYSLAYLSILALLDFSHPLVLTLERFVAPSLLRLMVPAMVYNSALMLLLLPLLNRVPEQRDIG